MSYEIQEMSIQDYDEFYKLWQESEGIELSDEDSREGIAQFLERNSGLSFIARDGSLMVGAALCGHDGRRGYIHHLAVLESHRRQGLGKALVGRCLFALMRKGIRKCHLFTFEDNPGAIVFWNKMGWSQRVELVTMSRGISTE